MENGQLNRRKLFHYNELYNSPQLIHNNCCRVKILFWVCRDAVGACGEGPLTKRHCRFSINVMPAKPLRHPYHYFKEKDFLDRIAEFGIPLLLFWIFFQFYNLGKFTPSEMVKTTGLLAISLLSLTLIIGPLSAILPFVERLKAYRKAWGVLSFVTALLHIALVFIFYYKFDLMKFIDIANPKYGGVLSGLLAIVILFLVTLTSNKKALNTLSPKTWKIIQTTSYLALILAVLHFFIVEQANGVLVIKRQLGWITFWFAIAAIVLRVVVLFWPRKKKK